MDSLLRIAGVALPLFAIGQPVVGLVVRHMRWRRRYADDVKDDLRTLNSGNLLRVPQTRLNVTSVQDRGTVGYEKTAKQSLNVRNHKVFCAQWARCAKARFEFARLCESTAVNVAALHRWITAELRKEGMSLLEISYVIDDIIDISFEPTYERMKVISKRKEKQRARMEYYNERKSLETIK